MSRCRCPQPSVLATLFLFLTASYACAQNCPTARNGPQGFVVERGDSQKSEISHSQDGIVRVVTRYSGTTLLETRSFQGLFQLERIEEGRRTTIKPRSDLAKLFPIKPGQQLSADFDFVDDRGRTTPGTVILSVKGMEPLSIGACRYSVLKIDHSESRGDRAPARISTDYYSPELKLVLMREYDRGGRTSSVKYDRIYPIKN